MSNLIISVIAIMLTATCVMLGISYVPWWQGPAARVEIIMAGTPAMLQTIYDKKSIIIGQNPTPTAEADGGFNSIFISNFNKIYPAVPSPGFSWSFGTNSNNASPYLGVNYFCLVPPSEGVSYAEYRGILNALKQVSASSLAVTETDGTSSGCGGATITQSNSTDIPSFDNKKHLYFSIYVNWVSPS